MSAKSASHLSGWVIRWSDAVGWYPVRSVWPGDRVVLEDCERLLYGPSVDEVQGVCEALARPACVRGGGE